MIPSSGPERPDGLPAYSPVRGGVDRRQGTIIAALALGMLLGFLVGWTAFRSPWSALVGPLSLYDEKLVTSVVEKTDRAVVEIIVGRPYRSRTLGANSDESGSGFLVDHEGHIVTNHHVVADSSDISVRLFDGRTVAATKLGFSPADDLAVLKVDPSQLQGIEPLALADSGKVVPGQMAIAIGSAFRNFNSVSVGVISGLDRTQGSVLDRPIPGLLQTDAALNPGNSGGPLLNSSAEVIGVNSSVRLASLVQIGVGFAIPSNTLRDILPDLKTAGEFKRVWVGIRSPQLTQQEAAALGLPPEGAIYVSEVCEGGPAQKAGIRGGLVGGGDLIAAVDGKPMRSITDMVSYLNSFRPGDEVTLTYIRDSKRQELDVTLAEWGSC